MPISGFGFLMSEGVRKALSQDGALGILTGGLTSAAAGISAAIVSDLSPPCVQNREISKGSMI